MDGTSLIDVNLDDAQELKTLPDGTEVELRIKMAEVAPKKNFPDQDNLVLIWEDPADPLVEEFKHWISIPCPAIKEAFGEQAYIKAINRFKKFLAGVGLDVTPPDAADFIGLTATVILGESEDKPEYGVQNFIRSFSPPRR